jgi:hypothetical protein
VPGQDGDLVWLTGNATEDSRSIEILLDTIATVTANIDFDSVLRDIVDRSLQVTRADRAILLLGDSPDNLTVRMAQDREASRWLATCSGAEVSCAAASRMGWPCDRSCSRTRRRWRSASRCTTSSCAP